MVKGGRLTEELVQTTDVFPTLCEIVGEDPGNYSGIEGLSLLKLLKHNEPLKRNSLIAFTSYGSAYATVLTNDHWKIVAFRDGKYELYQVDEDIAEEKDLSSVYPEKVEELAKILNNWKDVNNIDF